MQPGHYTAHSTFVLLGEVSVAAAKDQIRTPPKISEGAPLGHGGRLASSNRVIGVVLLCAHPRNAVYVAKWTFMCPLCGSKMGRLGALLGQFCRCWGHEVPCWRCFGQGGPGNARYGVCQGLLVLP